MKYFLTNQNKVLTKEQIYRSIWGDNVVDDNTIMVHIRRLRTKIEDDPNKPLYLRTIRGVGYQFRGRIVLSDFQICAAAAKCSRIIRSKVGRVT